MYPLTNLQPGQSGAEVKKLQDFLVSQGFMTQAQVNTGYGIYGPQTTAAVRAWQEANGVDNSTGPGYWGPKSIATAGKVGSSGQINQESINNLINEINEKAQNNSILSELINKGNTMEDLLYATSTGDLSKLTDFTGQPFSPQDQQNALYEAENELKDYYKAIEEKETADTEEALRAKKESYQNYLLSSGDKFEQDKKTLDQEAASKGVLFSGSREQKERNLKNQYEQEQAEKQANTAYDIGSIARNFQYKYGNNTAGNLSDYYSLGENKFNPNVATGGVSSGKLSSIYDPNKYNFQGTQLAEKTAAAADRAANKLWNRGNKLMSTGYLNKF